MRTLICLTLAVLLLNPTAAVSADFEKGLDAYYAGDLPVALREWRPLAQQGDARAQFRLGEMYRIGLAVPQDDKTAVKWLTLSAQQGHAYSTFKLGMMYRDGEKVPVSPVYAYMWFDISSRLGVERAGDYRDKLWDKMYPADIATALELTDEFWKLNPSKWSI